MSELAHSAVAVSRRCDGAFLLLQVFDLRGLAVDHTGRDALASQYPGRDIGLRDLAARDRDLRKFDRDLAHYVIEFVATHRCVCGRVDR